MINSGWLGIPYVFVQGLALLKVEGDGLKRLTVNIHKAVNHKTTKKTNKRKSQKYDGMVRLKGPEVQG